MSGLSDLGAGSSKIFGATYEVQLPPDYMHLLNCICIYKVNKRYKCYNAGDDVQFAAKRLTADIWSVIINDYYNRPLPWRPYYYLHQVNTNEWVPTNPLTNSATLNADTRGTDPTKEIPSNTLDSSGEGLAPRKISVTGFTGDMVEREAGMRYGNSSNVRLEIRYGHDDSIFELKKVFIDYIKTPQEIRLTQEQVNLTADTSQIMEFPDYVCQEIINELTTLVMENTADPRI